MINNEQRQKQIEQIQTELKELYEIAEEHRQPTFDMISNNLWTRYRDLTSEEKVLNLREECDNLLLTANEIERIRLEGETKERINQIESELTRLYSATTLSRKLDFDFAVDNLFDELSRLQEIDDTPALRQPYQALTVVADNEAMREIEQKEADIVDIKANLRNLCLKLNKNRKDTFLISTEYLFSKLMQLTSHDEATQFRTACLREHDDKEELYIKQLGIEFMDLSSKPTKDREQDHDDRKEQIVRELGNMVSRIELNEMIDDGIKADRRVKQREAMRQSGRQRQLARPRSENRSRDSKEMKESKQQDGLGLPIPQAQRDDQQKEKKRPSIEMSVTFEEENGSRHTGQGTETSVSRSITPVDQPQGESQEIEIDIEKSKEKSKTPEQKINSGIGTESEPPIIPVIE